jgi:hypothetical protein
MRQQIDCLFPVNRQCGTLEPYQYEELGEVRSDPDIALTGRFDIPRVDRTEHETS